MNDCFIIRQKGNAKKRGTKPQSVVPPFYIVLCVLSQIILKSVLFHLQSSLYTL